MNDEARLLFSLWETVSDILPTGERQESAAAMIRVLIEHGNTIELLRDAEGECPYLDRALGEVSQEIEEDQDDYYDNYNEEDE